jgi:diacylglycerol kinase family enzyme
LIHLFIINPKAKGIVVEDRIKDIRRFTISMPATQWRYHITRWRRDAKGYTRRFVSEAKDMVRVYAIGGDTTLFEVINGVIGLPNVEIAYCPWGADNALVYSLGGSKMLAPLRSLLTQSYSPVSVVDTIKVGPTYALCHCMIGAEAIGLRDGDSLARRTGLPRNFCYTIMGGMSMLIGKAKQKYTFNLDGEKWSEDCVSVLVANTSHYASGLQPAPDTDWQDGELDLYYIKPFPMNKLFTVTTDYVKGKHQKHKDFIFHKRGKRLQLSSNEPMVMAMEEQVFYQRQIDFEIVSASINMVLPHGEQNL